MSVIGGLTGRILTCFDMPGLDAKAGGNVPSRALFPVFGRKALSSQEHFTDSASIPQPRHTPPRTNSPLSRRPRSRDAEPSPYPRLIHAMPTAPR